MKNGYLVSTTRLVGVPGQDISTGVLVSAAPVDPHIAEMVSVGLLTFDVVLPNRPDGNK